MKKILCFVIVGVMALVFLSAPDVSAVTFNQIKWTDWDTKATTQTSDPSTGEHIGANVGQGILGILDTTVLAVFAVPVQLSLNPLSAAVYGYCEALLGDLSFADNRLRGNTCEVGCADKTDTLVFSYSGPCVGKLIFTSETSFEGKIKFTSGVDFVINMKGKKINEYPDLTP
jgi:hypothetical protein